RSLTGNVDIDGALNFGTNSLAIETGGTVNQSAAITASGLSLSGAGTKTLDNALNDVDTLASSGGGVSYTDVDGFSVGSVSVNGVTIDGISTTGTLTLSTTGTVTQTEAISASTLTVDGTGGIYTLSDTANDIDTLSGNTGSVSLTEDDGLSVGTLNATTVDIVSTGAITNSGAITVSNGAAFKTLNDAGVTITLDNAGNAFGTISAQVRNSADTAARGANISLTNTGDLVLGAITTTGSFALTADSDVTQSDAIQVDTLSLLGSGSYVLENASNTINTLGDVSRGGAFSIFDSSGGLDITGSFTGTLTNSVAIRTVGDLTLSSGASIEASGSGNNITLEASGGSFINNAGSSALTTDSRFLIYSEDNESPHEKGGLSGEEVFEVSFGEDPQATGNVFYYAATDPTPEESVSEEPETVEDPAPENPESVEDPSPEEPESTDELPVEAPEDPVVEPAPQTDPDLDSNPSLENDPELIEDTPITIAPSVSRDTSWVLPLGILPGAANESIGGVITSKPSAAISGADIPLSLNYLTPPETVDYFLEKLELEILTIDSGVVSESSDDAQ
ncbi:MAG: hypothetical protein ACPGN3_12715, partial [Opitutales bacterium]